ncbi:MULTISPECIES: restriction endonuclease [unclassified Enterobacter]|uniref:restriction endonuclease n=1 Tax=unclassified Enterobacter TaxID=2608935 RepID=UPI003B42F8AB
MEFNFDSLDPTQFEEFCYEVLLSLEPAHLDWRKGTPLGSSPSDQGRDLEAIFHKTDIDGSKFNERWNIECKHYNKGVPPEKLQGALSWAHSTRPDVLLIIASGYLSNACKNYLEQYVENNKPPFRIVIWERQKLETLTSGHKVLRAKYGLVKELSFMKLINNYHAEYSLKSTYNTLPFFIEALDELDPELRDEVFYEAYFTTIGPRFREPKNGQESLRDCMIDNVDYYTFKKKLSSMRYVPSGFVVAIVTQALASMFTGSDITNIKKIQDNWDAFLKDLSLVRKEENLEYMRAKRYAVEEEVKGRYERYNHFCNTFVRKLLSETRAI